MSGSRDDCYSRLRPLQLRPWVVGQLILIMPVHFRGMILSMMFPVLPLPPMIAMNVLSVLLPHCLLSQSLDVMMSHQALVLSAHSPNKACVWTLRVAPPLTLLGQGWVRIQPLLARSRIRGSTALSQPHLPGLRVLWGFRWLGVVTF